RAPSAPRRSFVLFFFFVSRPAPTYIYTLSLHDALPIFVAREELLDRAVDVDLVKEMHAAPQIEAEHHRLEPERLHPPGRARRERDRKSTRLNSSHVKISYAVFCLKKKKRYTAARRSRNQ